MSIIPGLGQAKAAAVSSTTIAKATTTTLQDLQAKCEWRFEVAFGQSVEVKILSGSAEIFGTELAINKAYTFRGTKASIYTWHGCRIEATGTCEEYVAEETPMVTYVNTHFALEKLRDEASQSGREGPRVLVVGPTNAGKTSLVKLLAAYAERVGRQPIVVNTDSREGMLSIPGSLTATSFSSIIDVEEGWGSSPTSGPSPVPVKLPLCYFYGLPGPEDNPKLYKPVLTRLALASTSRLSDDPTVKSSGIIIDTAGVISQGKGGYDIISHLVSDFSVNIILTLGSERLFSDMQRRFSAYKISTGEDITILKLDKSGGCVDRDDTYMHNMREAALKEYFFGNAKRTLSPHTQYVSFDELTVHKIFEAKEQMSFIPGGEESTEAALYEKIEPASEMSHCILAVMYAAVTDSQDTIRDAPVLGFVYVAEVDDKKRRMRILAPLNTRVTDRPMVWGSWPEASVNLLA